MTLSTLQKILNQDDYTGWWLRMISAIPSFLFNTLSQAIQEKELQLLGSMVKDINEKRPNSIWEAIRHVPNIDNLVELNKRQNTNHELLDADFQALFFSLCFNLAYDIACGKKTKQVLIKDYQKQYKQLSSHLINQVISLLMNEAVEIESSASMLGLLIKNNSGGRSLNQDQVLFPVQLTVQQYATQDSGQSEFNASPEFVLGQTSLFRHGCENVNEYLNVKHPEVGVVLSWSLASREPQKELDALLDGLSLSGPQSFLAEIVMTKNRDEIDGLDLARVAMTARIDKNGKLYPVDDIALKLNPNMLKRLFVYAVIVAEDQAVWPQTELYLQEKDIQLIRAESVSDAILQLENESLPKQSIRYLARMEFESMFDEPGDITNGQHVSHADADVSDDAGPDNHIP